MSFDMRVVPIVIVATVVGTLVLVTIIYIIYRTQLGKKQQQIRTELSEKASQVDATRKPRNGQRKTVAPASSSKRISLLTSLPTRPTRRFQHESSSLPGPVSSNPPNTTQPRGLRQKSSISNLEEGLLSVTEKNHKMLDKIDRDFISSPPSVYLSSGRARDGGAQNQFFRLSAEQELSGARERRSQGVQRIGPTMNKERKSLPEPSTVPKQAEERRRSLNRGSKELEPSVPLVRSVEAAKSSTHSRRDSNGNKKVPSQQLQAPEGSAIPKRPRSPAAMVLQPASPPRRATIDMEIIKAASISAMTSLFFDPKAPEPGSAREASNKPHEAPEGNEAASQRSIRRTSAPTVMATPQIRKESQTLQPFSPGQRLTSMLEETSTSDDSPNSAAANSSNSSKPRTRLPLHIHTKTLYARGETSFLESASTSDPGNLEAPLKDQRRSRHSITSSTLSPTYTVGGVTRIPIVPAPRPRSMNPRISRYPPPPPPKDPTDGGKPLPSPPSSIPPSIISDWRTDDSRSYNVSPISSRFPEAGNNPRQSSAH